MLLLFVLLRNIHLRYSRAATPVVPAAVAVAIACTPTLPFWTQLLSHQMHLLTWKPAGNVMAISSQDVITLEEGLPPSEWCSTKLTIERSYNCIDFTRFLRGLATTKFIALPHIHKVKFVYLKNSEELSVISSLPFEEMLVSIKTILLDFTPTVLKQKDFSIILERSWIIKL